MKYLLLNKNYFKNKRKKEIYFHDWCLEDSQNNFSEQFFKKFESERICKYHWENKNKLKKDIKFLIKLANTFLEEITIDINKFHNVNYPSKYWKIILLPWLKQFLAFFYDRWEMVEQISKKDLVFCIYRYQNTSFIPEEFGDFNSQSKDFNYWIISQIIEYKKNIKIIKKKKKI